MSAASTPSSAIRPASARPETPEPGTVQPASVQPASVQRGTGQPGTGPAGRAGSARLSARDRLLAAADELFYEEGIHTVGIDRVIEKAGVAKASLYSTFGSKDELVRAYLNGRHTRRRERITRRLAAYDDPRERLLGVFDLLGEQFAEPGYHGCAFVNASAESVPGSAAEQASTEYRAWVRDLMTGLARDAGAPDPVALAGQLVLLYDGANISARMDRNLSAGATARTVAAILLDTAAPAAP